jgi:hypothetical protein
MDSYILNNGSYDTNLLILRSLFAVNPATNLPISTGYIIATDGAGGINWVDPILFGGITLPNLLSTVGGLGSIQYVSTSFLNVALTSTSQGLGTINFVSTSYLNTALFSTSQGLGTLQYVSTSYLNAALISTIENLAVAGYVSSTTLALTTSTANAALTSTQFILDRSRYVSTGALQSTVAGLLINPEYVVDNAKLDTALVSTTLGLGVFGYISTSVFRSSLTSTVQGLATAGYVSTATLRSSLVSTVQGLGSAGYVSTGYLVSYVGTSLANAATNYDYVSSPTVGFFLQSTIDGLNTAGYISTSYLTNYVTNALANVGTSGDYVSTPTLNVVLTSTTIGLGSLLYVSSSALQSTTAYLLDSSRYVSTGALTSTVTGIFGNLVSPISVEYLNTALVSTVADLGTRKENGFVSTLSLTSTVRGLASGGDRGYISSLSLQSTVQQLAAMIAGGTNITFDAANNVTVVGGNINIASMGGNIIYLSTFLQSSVTYRGTNGHTFPYTFDDTNMIFSTCVVPFNAMSSFTNEKSRVYLDIFPTFVFAQNGVSPNSSKTLILPISTFIQYGSLTANVQSSNLLPYVNTSYLVANTVTTGFSNYFQQQIKLQIPGSLISGNWTSNYILYHYMPNSISFGTSPGLRNSTMTIQYSSTNSVFISVQNLP